MAGYGKVEISPFRLDWNPTPLPEQVVLVTTIALVFRPRFLEPLHPSASK